jgi:hypothetical protein
MDTDDNVASRDDMMNGDNSGSIIVNLPPPPEIAVKTRCYKLNLDSDMFPAPSVFLGPFADMPPPLTYSASSSESEDATPLQVAIQTAQIFRGITIGNDGTILSQNARATRSSRGQTKNKRGEKSRQAAKIEQAKDLVEETILTGKVCGFRFFVRSENIWECGTLHEVQHTYIRFLILLLLILTLQAPESDEDAHMQSLYIMGEYDDMKYLVRDGSKKLRDAAEFPDDTLLTINRLRPNDTGMIMDAAFQSSPRKRGPSSSSSSSGLHRGGGSKTMQPPKLKSHPRDRPSSRTGKDDKLSRRHQLDGESEHGQHRGENWGNALPVNFSRGFHSIWNCGATGDDSTSGRATSPTQVVASPRHDGKSQSSHHSSHHHHHSGSSNVHSNGIAAHHYSSKPMYEGRDSQQYGQARESGVTTRAT